MKPPGVGECSLLGVRYSSGKLEVEEMSRRAEAGKTVTSSDALRWARGGALIRSGFVVALVILGVGCQKSSTGNHCGDGALDPGEMCDPGLSSGTGVCPTHCDDGNVCTEDVLDGSAVACTAVCRSAPVRVCSGGDGCCPAGCNAANDFDCSATCGNGLVESDAGETCDGNCPTVCNDGNACTIDSMMGSVENCNVSCTFTSIGECAHGDGCCPAGCNAASDNDCSGFCGDGVVQEGETCDGSCPSECNDGNACTIDTMTGSPGNCNVACSFQAVSECRDGDGCCAAGCNSATDGDCSASCGNGVVESGETCDGDCPAECNDGVACTIDRMTGSPDTCNVACTYQPIAECSSGDSCCPAGCNAASDSDCPAFCGNGLIDAGETCDGECPTECNDGNACTLDTMTGTPESCNATCSFAPISECSDDDDCCPAGCNTESDSDCSPSCGDGHVDDGETCDGDCPDSCNDDNACTIDTLTGSVDTCNVDCSNAPISECRDGDDCCPPGCIHSTDDDCPEGSSAIGEACLTNTDCASGACLEVELNAWHEGYCSQGCSAAVPCPEGAHCAFTDDDGLGFCLASCEDTEDCRVPEYACYDRDGEGVSECAPVGLGEGAPGDACTDIVECSGGRLAGCTTEHWDFRGGYCTIACLADEGCPDGSHCGFIGEDGWGSCIPSCEAADDCREDGYLCFDADEDEAEATECFPAATGEGAVGAPCEGSWDCTGGIHGICGTPDDGWPSGYCTINCTEAVGADCPAETNCVEFGSGSFFCLDGCAASEDCRDDYECTDVTEDGPAECYPS